MIIEFRWHDSEQVNIASLMMLISGNRTKNTHRSNTKALTQLLCMTFDNIRFFPKLQNFS